jgi:RimJ/RimL family protein N-acetyltransferase
MKTIYQKIQKNGIKKSIQNLFYQKFPFYTCYVFWIDHKNKENSIEWLSISRYGNINEVNKIDIKIISNYNKEFHGEAKKKFAKQCEMWLGKINGNIASVCWSRCQAERKDYFVLIKNNDAVISSCFVMPEYRGKRIFPSMLEHIVCEMYEHNKIQNFYIDCKSWNISSIRGIEKSGFKLIGKAICFDIFNKRYYLYNNCFANHRNYKHD